jgi:hypothetical protein
LVFDVYCFQWCSCLILVRQPQWARASSFTRFLDCTKQCTTVGRTPLEKWSACHRDFYLTTIMLTTSMPPVGFKPTISTSEWL